MNTELSSALENVDKTIDEMVTEETYTAWGASKVVNNILIDALSIRKRELPPQMFYTYYKKGYIGTIDDNGKVATGDALRAWAKKYCKKQLIEALVEQL